MSENTKSKFYLLMWMPAYMGGYTRTVARIGPLDKTSLEIMMNSLSDEDRADAVVSIEATALSELADYIMNKKKIADIEADKISKAIF